MKSRRGPECLGVRASWPPVVALVVMNGRPAPRCKRRRYRCAAFAQPIRTSTVGYTCAYSLRVSRTPDPQNSGRPSLRVQRTDPSRRVLPLIERNILMILFRHRVPVTRGHRATVDRTVDLLLPGHLGRFLFLRRRLLLFRSRGFRRGSGRGRRRSAAARRALRQRDAGRQAIREPLPTRPPQDEAVFAWNAPVPANSVSGAILLRPPWRALMILK